MKQKKSIRHIVLELMMIDDSFSSQEAQKIIRLYKKSDHKSKEVVDQFFQLFVDILWDQ